jgi:class 3 adenylate cyclase/pimeloyl-ACP methyl ester carboxylesterase
VAAERVARRLAVILAADMAGYSRLMEADELGTIARQKTHHETVIGPKLAEHGGRIVQTAGDGMLIEFHSAVSAVECAAAIQEALSARERGLPEAQRIAYRIGINLGDIVIEGDDIMGNGVNIAARLQELSPPGGICISAAVYEQIESAVDVVFEDLGQHRVKNIRRPIRVWRWAPDRHAGAPREIDRGPAPEQNIQFTTTSDGIHLAYAAVGRGPPVVIAGRWLTHLEHDWRNPLFGHFLHELSGQYTLIRYDARGNGLSDWDVDEFSLEDLTQDLATVVDALDLRRFALIGRSQGCAVSIAYAVRNPERVSRMVLCGGYARGRRRRGSREDAAEGDALVTFIRKGWGQDTPAYRQVFASMFMPDATPEQVAAFSEVQRIATSPDNAARLRQTLDDIDVSDLLPRVSTPTLVVHSRNDAFVPFSEGRLLASSIRGARFVALESRNHIMLEQDPEWPRFLAVLREFLDEETDRRDSQGPPRPAHGDAAT